MRKPDNCLLVIFGASGDLATRKLVPALYSLHTQNLLPQNFAVLGVSRTKFSDTQFREKMANAILDSRENMDDDSCIHGFAKKLFYLSMDMEEDKEYKKFKDKLQELSCKIGFDGNVIFYLATPPALYGIVPLFLGEHGLNKYGSGEWRRLIVEKPFGYDLETAVNLNAKIRTYFSEDQIYRIDHYLGKETVQNILAFRFANGIFEPLWNRNYIHHVEITAAETLGIENRATYYDQTGAMRDMVQNHLLQILGTIAMEPPAIFSTNSVRNETVKVFQSICPIPTDKLEEYVIRGQYLKSVMGTKKVKGYRGEVGVNSDSRTETFVAMKINIDNWRWGGVPFYIRTGKRLPTRVTEVVIHFRKTPHQLFKNKIQQDTNCNQLVIRIQPDEGILLQFGMKIPGAEFNIKEVMMDFHYSDLADTRIPTAYERLLLDCMLGDTTLYARSDAVEACWEFITPIIKKWEDDPQIALYGYPAGSWGPKEASNLFNTPGQHWRCPCKSMTDDTTYCKL